MSDMRLIVAGAGGRMGRSLTRVISETPGAVLTGALVAARVRRVGQSLDEGFDIEILEMHHKAKVDAPSGTAFLLGEAAAAGRKITLQGHWARGRDGHTGARRSGDIGFASLRGGTVT